MGGTMTTAGADVDMRESYSTYLERSSAADVMTDALPDIDLYDHDNPLAVTQYVNDIYQYWYKVEVSTPRKQRLAVGGTSAHAQVFDTSRPRMSAVHYDVYRDKSLY